MLNIYFFKKLKIFIIFNNVLVLENIFGNILGITNVYTFKILICLNYNINSKEALFHKMITLFYTNNCFYIIHNKFFKNYNISIIGIYLFFYSMRK